jgi:predicted nucleotidyltransferase
MFGLPEKVLALLRDYFHAHPQIIRVIVYGSRAMGKETPGSDVDLAIITKSEEDISGAVQSDLEELPTPYLFDVIDYQRITHAPLREHIDRVGKTLFQKED